MAEPTDYGRAETLAIGEPHRVQLVAPVAADERERYRDDGELGKGGMGIVSLRFDKRIGRRVATKRLRKEIAGDAGIRARFLREAQVQGQLEHPAVVPVYDLGLDADGAPYFVMKTVQGVTLRDVIERLRAGDAETVRKYPRHRLLTAFTSVCLAVDYAHEHGILHRDLKPANLMLGDYGEVYVLDWGLAKITGAPDDGLVRSGSGDSGDTPAPDAMTHVGAMMGTPGYMAPEQIEQPSNVGPAADVYSLGAILFELLTLQRLHRGSTSFANLESTRVGADARASVRAPDRDIAPELDAVCVKATAQNPAARAGTPRELHDAVERYLAGEQDLSLRRLKSAEHARAAAEAVRMVQEGSAVGLESRRHAMREIGRALALDPENVGAVSTMVTLLSHPPAHTPPEVAFEMEKEFRRDSRWIGSVGAVCYPAMLLFLPLFLLMGVRQPAIVGAFFGLLFVSAGLSVLVMRSRVPPLGSILISMVCSTAAFALAARFSSPFLIAPTALAVNAAGYAIFLKRQHRVWVTVTACLAFLVPLGMELTGALSRTFTFATGGGMTVHPMALDLPQGPTIALAAVSMTAALLLSTIVVGHIRDRLADAERRLLLYTWHLREFVPPEARQATDPTA